MDVSAGRDGTWRRTAASDEGDDGGGGMEAHVVPFELYDSARAKIEASLRWLLAKAYGTDHIPEELRDPFYTDQYEQEHIKPPIIHLLLSGELYCRVCGLILPAELAASLQSHHSVIQALSRKGIFVLETNNTPVSDLDLSLSPIKMRSHIHLIDALMTAYTAEMISIEKVAISVQHFSITSATEELPSDLEDAMIFWINKVNVKMREISEKECKLKQHLLNSPSHQKPDLWHALAHCLLEPEEFSRVVRYRREHLSGRTLQHFPLLEELLKDVCDGAALLALIHFYCPDLIRLEDICLKEVPSITESLYNIQLLKEFSSEYLNKCFYLKPEDLLYSQPVLKKNIMVFIAELFWWFESVKPDFVQPRDLQETKNARLTLQPKTSRSYVSASNVTKRTFLSSSSSADFLTSTTGTEHSTISTSQSPSPSLLPLRQRQQKVLAKDTSDLRNRPKSMVQIDGHHRDSVMAWTERRARPLSQTAPYALHFPTEDEADSISLARSISKDSLASNFMTPKHMRSQHRLSGQSLLSHMRIEDEEEEIEEEELVAVFHPSMLCRRRIGSDMEYDELNKSTQAGPVTQDHKADSYYLDPLMPAVPKLSKEKSITVNKQEESGESRGRGAVGMKKTATNVISTSQRKFPVAGLNRNTNPHKSGGESEISSVRPEFQSEQKQSSGFYLHLTGEVDQHSQFPSAVEAGQDSDSDIADLEEDDEEDNQTEMEKTGRRFHLAEDYMTQCIEGEGESDKLRKDLKVSEKEEKEAVSGRSSPCPSTSSWASSCSASGSASVKLTSFAERKLLKLGLRDGFSSTSSSQKTTPDGSELPPAWQGKEPSFVLGKNLSLSPSVVPSELLQLHMQLEEQRRAIEHQKKKMEALSAKQRLKLGKAAFLNIVKKGGGKSDTLPLPLKNPLESPGIRGGERRKIKIQSCKDDSCLDVLKNQANSRLMTRDNSWNSLSQDNSSEPDMNDCSRSIDLLNQAISSIQQQMMQLSLQQDLLMKQNVVSSPECSQTETTAAIDTTQVSSSASDSRSFTVHFVDIGGSGSLPARRLPKLNSSQRSKATERKQIKENSRSASAKSALPPPDSLPSTRQSNDAEQETASSKSDRSIHRNATFRVHESSGEVDGHISAKEKSQDPPVIAKTSEPSSQDAEQEETNHTKQGREFDCGNEKVQVKGQLIEIDLSEVRDCQQEGTTDITEGAAETDQKGGLGFFFKDDEKAEDEMAKRRAAFLLKQQRKAEEARVRKLQQETESELKRDEARRKAEEERIRKEEEKARRELIKQEYLRRKQQALMEEQGLVKPRARTRPRRNRPKSLHREDSSSLPKGSTTPDLSFTRGSTLSLANDADSVISGGAESNRAASVCSMDSFPMLSRTPSRNMERDWENGSIASSVTSVEYNGPKLFKEPSSKSNKPIIINAIAHCCLAGKVNEVQKNVVLEELEKCESNHLIILFRDGGCQFRAIYAYSPETDEIIKFTGTGPRSITQKMVDRLYKYNSDRKQFTVIPAKSVSVSVDALTIHNQLWHVKRPGSARRK